MTVRFAPAYAMRTPFELGWSPSAASMTPAFTISSLNAPIAATSSLLGSMPASERSSALTSSMNRILLSPPIRSVVDRRVRRGPEIGVHARCPGKGQPLRHQYADHLLCRVRRPRRAVAAIPAVPAGHRAHVVAPGDHRHAEAPPAVVPEAGERVG